MISLYWNIGKMIIERQNGRNKAKYGDYLLKELSIMLVELYGRGFSLTNLKYMRTFYNIFPISQTLSDQLSWSHYIELIKIKEKNKRDFYMQECINSRWNVRELQRQIATLLYERILISKDRIVPINNELKEDKTYETRDIIKDPFVLEFLDIKENTDYLESDLEKNIIERFY